MENWQVITFTVSEYASAKLKTLAVVFAVAQVMLWVALATEVAKLVWTH